MDVIQLKSIALEITSHVTASTSVELCPFEAVRLSRMPFTERGSILQF